MDCSVESDNTKTVDNEPAKLITNDNKTTAPDNIATGLGVPLLKERKRTLRNFNSI